jgi:hypothetical protein
MTKRKGNVLYATWPHEQAPPKRTRKAKAKTKALPPEPLTWWERFMTYLRRPTIGRNATVIGGSQSQRPAPPPTVVVEEDTTEPVEQTQPIVPIALDTVAPPVSISTAPQTQFYGDTPPANPQPGMTWTNTQGQMYVYIEPGFWSAIGTNW